MELIRSLKERHKASQRNDIWQRAESTITLDDFDNSIYIAYNGVPLVPIENDWTPEKIINKLSELRTNYVKAMTTEHKMPQMVAALL